MSYEVISPPEPADSWPEHIELVAGTFDRSGEVMFESTGWPWSEGRRTDSWVELEWEQMSFRITPERVIIDAVDPQRAVDLQWNIVQATAYELGHTSTMHGFMAGTPSGAGVAVLGLSGAGKTTTGRALLAAGCDLVADDLIILHEEGVRVGRPFVRRADTDHPADQLDIGGKFREPAKTVSTPVPLTDILVLCPDDVPQRTPLDPMTATDLLLKGAYVPFEVSTTSARTRLVTVLDLVSSGVRVRAARSRSATPEEFAAELIDQAENSAKA